MEGGKKRTYEPLDFKSLFLKIVFNNFQKKRKHSNNREVFERKVPIVNIGKSYAGVFETQLLFRSTKNLFELLYNTCNKWICRLIISRNCHRLANRPQ